jgi:hypothetical protein
MHKNATKCNKTQSKWCINKHGASKIIDTFETYQLHQSMKNISMKVVVGFALPSKPGAYFHGFLLPASYARAGVNEVEGI